MQNKWLVHEEFKQDLVATEKRISEHVSFEIVEKVNRIRESVQQHIEEINKFYQEFWSNLNTPALSV